MIWTYEENGKGGMSKLILGKRKGQETQESWRDDVEITTNIFTRMCHNT